MMEQARADGKTIAKVASKSSTGVERIGMPSGRSGGKLRVIGRVGRHAVVESGA